MKFFAILWKLDKPSNTRVFGDDIIFEDNFREDYLDREYLQKENKPKISIRMLLPVSEDIGVPFFFKSR